MAINRVLAGAHVEVEFGLGPFAPRDPEKLAKRMEQEARDFMDFVRDHRSQDIHGVTVVREYEYKCSHCGWVYDHDSEKPECCEKAIREWATPQELEVMGYTPA